MRIESVEIENFKVLRHLRLDDIPDLIVIAGPNGSGKTSLFEAIRVFKEAIATYSLQYQGAVYINQLLQQVGPVVRAGEPTASITLSIRVSEAERQAISLPEDHSGLLSGSVTVTVNAQAGQREYAQLVSSGNGNLDAPYLQQLLGGYRSGGVLGMVDHIGPDRRFTASQVANISFSDQEEEQELQRLILNTMDKFASLTQDLVRMSFIDMQELAKNVEEPHKYIEGVRQIFQHFLPEQEFVDVKALPPSCSPLFSAGGTRSGATGPCRGFLDCRTIGSSERTGSMLSYATKRTDFGAARHFVLT